MKNLSYPVLILLSLVLGLPSAGFAAPVNGARNFGLGIVLGEPTGLSAQYVLEKDRKLDFSLAYSFNSWVQITADYIFMRPQWVNSVLKRSSPVSAYWGAGLLLGVVTDSKKDGDLGFALRIPFGLEGMLDMEPIGFFVELVPGMELAPSTDFIFQGGLGARYYF
ncbi:MAG: hypothetical protein A2X97_07785 [Bdellovibrionales bacterium GWA1_52_35]|nr:MAG: hypothetical protein A2X97_07785 [Bdellovibrionales bacterium GWA1_52_35]